MKTKRGLLLLFLIIAALCCRMMPQWLQLQHRAPIVFLGMLRSMIYMGIFLFWGFSIKRRIVAPKTRQCLLMVASLLVFWVLIRTAKYFFVEDADIRRMLWYLYYLPMLGIPFLAVCTSELLGKPEYYEPPKWLVWPFFITLGMLGFVLTNDFHQCVFRFPKEALEHTDADFSYGLGYAFVFAWEILCAVYAVWRMIVKCRIPGERRMRMLPFVPVTISVFYGLLYVTRIPLFSALTKDVTIFQCLFFMLCLESCIQCNLIQSNANYVEFFTQSKLPMMITDMDGRLRFQSHTMVMPRPEEMRLAEVEPVMLEDQHRLMQCEITGGRVFWKEDISKIAQATAHLREVNESLEEYYQMKKEEVRTQREKERLREANRIYDQMQKQTEMQLSMMEELLKAFTNESDAVKRKEIVWKLSVLGAYLKRRNNLLFLSETDQRIEARELDYCFDESLRAIRGKGIKGTYHFDLQKPLNFSTMMKLYDAFEEVVEMVMDELKGMNLLVYRVEEKIHLHLSINLNQEKTITNHAGFVIEKEADCAWELRYIVEGE